MPGRRKPLLGRFAAIIVLTLVAPVVALTVVLDMRVHDLLLSRAEDALLAGKRGLLGRIESEGRELRRRAEAIAGDPAALALLRGGGPGRGQGGGWWALFGRQVDFSATWLAPGRGGPTALGPQFLGRPELDDLVLGLANHRPALRLGADRRGLCLSYPIAVAGGGGPEYLVLQRLVARGDLESMQASLGQELSIVDPVRGRVLYASAGLPAETPRPAARALLAGAEDRLSARGEAGRTTFSLWFAIPQENGQPLAAVVSMPDRRILDADSARSYGGVALAVLALIVLSSVLLSRRVVSPILSLSYAVQSMREHIANNGPVVVIPVKDDDEVGDLARSINQLGQDLRRSMEKIQEQRAEIVAYTHSLEERVQERTRQLEDARMRAERANLHKSKFLVNMNHELRTPLNSIAGITDLLRFGAYEKHEEVAIEFGSLWRLLLDKDGTPVETLDLLEDLATGLGEESNPLKVILGHLEKKLKAGGADAAATALLGKIQFLADDEERQLFRAYNNIRDAGESLLGIIDEVINLSRIESGVININPRPTDVAELVNICMTHAESYARAKHKLGQLRLSRAIEAGVPATLLLDAQKVKQVLLNLLTNAVKYTDHGYIHCRVGLVAEGGAAFLHCSVQDSGRGIAEADRDLLFVEFGRAFEVREIEGSGLGLALSRKLIERHGGSMGFDSREGGGSTFWFTLPVVRPPEPA